MSEKSKGTLCGIVAAVSYGMNPLGALSLYRAGINTNSVLFYRYALAAVLLAALLLVQKTSLRITRREFSVLGLLGVMFAVSSLTLFMSFHYMDAGIASTLLFVYPVMVAVIMAIFFRERISLVTVLSISLALCGIALLYRGEGGAVLNTAGVVLVMASSLSYALYYRGGQPCFVEYVVGEAYVLRAVVRRGCDRVVFAVLSRPAFAASLDTLDVGVGGDAGSDSYGRFAGVDDRCRACHRFYSDRCYGGFGAADGSGDRRDDLR